MINRALFLIMILVAPTMGFGGEFQFTSGASSTTYDDVPEANTWGLSARMQYNFSVADSGWIIHYYGPAESVAVGELSVGYEWKSNGPFYFEGGGGAAYSRIWGLRPMVVAGVGYRITETVFIDLPVMLTANLTIIPYIGVTF